MKSKTPTLISQLWTDAFLVFINIRIQKHTSEAPVLLKYPSFNREIQRLHGDTAWIAYDQSFIKLRESIELAWQKAVEELWGNVFLCLRRKNYGQPSWRKTAATEVVSALLQSEGCERAPHVLTPMHAKYVAATTKRLNVHNHKRARDTRNLHTSKVGQTRVLLLQLSLI